ncbi:MAG: MoaD/ThiS family protein [Calditrichaeota bacterium]|nr:MoaD/ThiS family protein [Candidatus Cloacimonadota bacterium]MCA9785723.1 MoaD/ThiS family protein [Candidatus Cloacimonadota bacterium]MCB1046609.1 MoaD/ThiS family protein [Calditrichota bacterium]
MNEARRIQVEYFALLREQAGCSRETRVSAAKDAGALFAELAAQHGFTLTRQHLRVAVNDEFADWHTELQEGDRVVFIPPVAGG